MCFKNVNFLLNVQLFVLDHHKILKDKTPHPKFGNGIPRCEIYLRVTNPKAYLDKGLSLGGKLVCDLKQRSWEEEVGYITDLDGHILAFAKSK